MPHAMSFEDRARVKQPERSADFDFCGYDVEVS
jgi:hypothetical protein